MKPSDFLARNTMKHPQMKPSKFLAWHGPGRLPSLPQFFCAVYIHDLYTDCTSLVQAYGPGLRQCTGTVGQKGAWAPGMGQLLPALFTSPGLPVYQCFTRKHRPTSTHAVYVNLITYHNHLINSNNLQIVKIKKPHVLLC